MLELLLKVLELPLKTQYFYYNEVYQTYQAHYL